MRRAMTGGGAETRLMMGDVTGELTKEGRKCRDLSSEGTNGN